MFKLILAQNGSYGFEKGSKLVYNVTKGKDGTDPKANVTLTVSGKQNQEWDGKWGTNVTRSFEVNDTIEIMIAPNALKDFLNCDK